MRHYPSRPLMRYASRAPLNHGARGESRKTTKAHSRAAAFFVRDWHTSTFFNGGCVGAPTGAPVSFVAGLSTLHSRRPCLRATAAASFKAQRSRNMSNIARIPSAVHAPSSQTTALRDLQSQRLLSRWMRVMKIRDDADRLAQFIALKADIDRHVIAHESAYSAAASVRGCA